MSSAWLQDRVQRRVDAAQGDLRLQLDAHRELAECRKSLDQRNANPQMVAERALLALRRASAA